VDHQTAEDAIVAALAAVGLPVSVAEPGGDRGFDLVVDVGGVPLGVQLKTAATVTPESLKRWPNRPTPSPGHAQPLVVVVADRVLAAARDALRERGWGWLDLRGHLYLSGPGVLVDTDLPAIRSAHRSANPFAGAVGLETACALLMNPNRPAAVRRLAREIGRSPSSVSSVLEAFRRDQLITREDKAAIPELFWATASIWKPLTTEVARLSIVDDPAIATSLHTGWENPEGNVGWALADAMAAAAYGAPIGIRSGYPPDFYVPDAATARRAETLLGLPMSRETRGATLRVAPVPQVCGLRNPPIPNRAPWPLAHPLFVALDLANDPGRGREVLSDWTPPEGYVRVW
jgi:hypothetical protein